MLRDQTIDKLNAMRLSSMAIAFARQMENPSISELSFEERFGLIVDHEWTSRQNRKLSRLIKNASFKFNDACIEAIDWDPRRELDRTLILSLASCNWINEHLNIIIGGSTGVGKSWMSCAFGNTACRHDISVQFLRTPRLLTDLAISRGDGTYNHMMSKLKKIPLLILDDWLVTPLDSIQCRDLLEVMEERYNVTSTIFSCQMPIEEWYDRFGDPTLADAIMDRCIHNAYTVNIKGDTKRKGKNHS